MTEKERLEGKVRMLGFMIHEYDKLIRSYETSRAKLSIERIEAKKKLKEIKRNEPKNHS